MKRNFKFLIIILIIMGLFLGIGIAQIRVIVLGSVTPSETPGGPPPEYSKYIYGINTSYSPFPTHIFNKDTLTVSKTIIFPNTRYCFPREPGAVKKLDIQREIAYVDSSYNMYLMPQGTTSDTDLKIVRYNLADDSYQLFVIYSTSVTWIGFVDGLAYNNYLYVLSNYRFLPKLFKIKVSDMSVELSGATLDQYTYVGMLLIPEDDRILVLRGYNYNCYISRFKMSDFTYIDSVLIGSISSMSGKPNLVKVGNYLYWLVTSYTTTRTAIYRVNYPSLSNPITLVLNSQTGDCLIIDENGEYGYLATTINASNSGKLHKISLSSFSVIKSVDIGDPYQMTIDNKKQRLYIERVMNAGANRFLTSYDFELNQIRSENIGAAHYSLVNPY